MSLSLNSSRLLHRAYPVLVLAVAFMSWAGMVQGNEQHFSFQPPDSQTTVSLDTSPRACSINQDPLYLKHADSCPVGEQDYSIPLHPHVQESEILKFSEWLPELDAALTERLSA